MPQTRPKILLAVLAAVAFLPFLGRRDIVTSHEARVVQTARAMAHAGWPWDARPLATPAVRLAWIDEDGDGTSRLRLIPDPAAPKLLVNPWLVPTLNDQIRLQKPPLPYWGTAMLFRLAGGQWSEALARLIPALFGALSTLLIYDLARLTIGRRAAAPAAFVWVTTFFLADEFRKAMADPYLTFFSLAATWGWIRAATSARSASRLPMLVFYVATALGLLAKGPVLFVHVLVPIVLFHLCRRRRPGGTIAAHLLGLALLAAIALPWPIYVINHVPHAIEIWRFESIGEMTDNIEKAEPLWYYLPQLFLVTLPWTPIWLYAIVLRFRRRGTRSPGTFGEASRPGPPGRERRRALHLDRRKFPLAWYALVLCFFSLLVHVKKNAYLLPVMPAQTLMIAQAVVAMSAILGLRRRMRRPAFNETLATASTLTTIAILAVLNFVRTPTDNARSPRPACAFIALALANEPHTTIVPAKLPPEASLYLPVDVAYDPAAHTVLYLLDDPKGKAETDLASFARRLPELSVRAVSRILVPNDGPAHRYKLFRLDVVPGGPKSLALTAAAGL